MNARSPFELCARNSRRISISAKARFNPSRINTSKKFSNFCISLIQLDFKPTRINTSGNKDLKSPRINTSKKQGRVVSTSAMHRFFRCLSEAGGSDGDRYVLR
jgi:hypothetical protein